MCSSELYMLFIYNDLLLRLSHLFTDLISEISIPKGLKDVISIGAGASFSVALKSK